MDSAAQKDPGVFRRQAQQLADDWIGDHRHGRESGDADHCQQRIALAVLMLGQHGGNRQGRRSATDGDGAAGQHAEVGTQVQQARTYPADKNGRSDCKHCRQNRFQTQRTDLFQRDTRAQQGYTYAQNRP
ncbi:hypothetical protein D3C78_1114030 [compost metagenome]